MSWVDSNFEETDLSRFNQKFSPLQIWPRGLLILREMRQTIRYGLAFSQVSILLNDSDLNHESIQNHMLFAWIVSWIESLVSETAWVMSRIESLFLYTVSHGLNLFKFWRNRLESIQTKVESFTSLLVSFRQNAPPQKKNNKIKITTAESVSANTQALLRPSATRNKHAYIHIHTQGTHAA